MKIYQKKNRNYQILSNLKEISNNNNNILNELKNIFDFKNLFDIYTKTINIHNKMMNIKVNGNIFNDNKADKKAKINKIICGKTDILTKLIYLALISEQSRKYDDMIEFIKKYCSEKTDDLNFDERELMNNAFKNNIQFNRIAIINIIEYEKKERQKDKSIYLLYILEYKKYILDEYIEDCQNIIILLVKFVYQKQKKMKIKVFI